MSSTERNIEGHVKSFVRIFKCECRWRELSGAERLVVALSLSKQTLLNELHTLAAIDYDPIRLKLLEVALNTLITTLTQTIEDHNDVNNPND